MMINNDKIIKAVIQKIKDNILSEEIGLKIINSIVQNSALAELEKHENGEMDIAIIGVSGRYPGAENIDVFWENLKNGRDSVCEVPEERWDLNAFYDSNVNKMNKCNCKRGGWLENIYDFDSTFFKISYRESEYIDPHQRLLLQETYRAFEDAGYTFEKLDNVQCGVFVGYEPGDYLTKLRNNNISPDLYTFTGVTPPVLSGRISYFYNLKGPSITLNTGCSTSLAALNMACDSILSGNCNMALVGGVTLALIPDFYILLSQMKMLSPDGVCRTFDENANGFVPGEGVGAIVIKPLKNAIEDKDNIYGIIKGIRANQDGKSNGITAPNEISQTELEKQVYQDFGIDPSTISYIETHGTGTKIGDPIEVNALINAFSTYTNKKGFCALGSVKTNIGHTMIASGMASLTKVLLCMKHKTLVPSIHYNKLNPEIELEDSPFYIITKKQEWKLICDSKRRAAINGFGIAGTNVHVVLEEYEGISKTQDGRVYYIIPFSAKTEKSCLNILRYMLEKFKIEKDNISMLDLMYTLTCRRNHFTVRCAFIVHSIEELINKINDVLDESKNNIEFSKEIIDTKLLKNNKEYSIFDVNLFEDTRIALEKAKELYLKGYDLNWEKYFEDKSVTCISLPNYCFDTKFFWPGKGNMNKLPLSYSGNKTKEEKQNNVPENNVPVNYYHGVWVEKQLNVHSISLSDKECVILFVSSWEQYNKICASAPSNIMKYQLIGVIQSSAFKKIDEMHFEIGYMFEDYSKLLHNLHNMGKKASYIIFAWNNDEWMIDGTTFENESKVRKTLYPMFYLVEVLTRSKDNKDANILFLCNGKNNSLYEAIVGYMRTINLEQEKLFFKYIAVSKEELIELVWKELADCVQQEICYMNGKRYQKQYKQLEAQNNQTKNSFRYGGVYLISGGLGSIGYLISQYLSEKWKAKLILIGHTPLDNSKEKKLNQIIMMGGNAEYYCVDLKKEDVVLDFVNEILCLYGNINGVIHCAGITRDNIFLKKTKEEIEAVLEPKIQGIWNLNNATKNIKMDFFVCFSSTTSVLGSMGLSDYAYANHYMDLFCYEREKLVERKKCYGSSISISWPFWVDGGMQIPDYVQERLYNEIGMVGITAKEGTKIFEYLVNLRENHVFVLKGDTKKIQSVFDSMNEPQRRNSTYVDKKNLPKKVNVRELVLSILSEETYIPSTQFFDTMNIEELGLDSIIIQKINQKLENIFGNVPKTLFYEFGTIEELIYYFEVNYQNVSTMDKANTRKHALQDIVIDILSIETHIPKEVICNETDFEELGLESILMITLIDKLEKWFPALPKTLFFELKTVGELIEYLENNYGEISLDETEMLSKDSKQIVSNETQSIEYKKVREDIAIIGLSGKFPGARNIDEYWENLRNGTDSVTEIPIERWNYREYYSEDRKEADKGKTYCKSGGFISGADLFEPLFFGISPKEAELMDPQERILLEQAWWAMEDAGYVRSAVTKSENIKNTGVFIGLTTNTYALNGPEEWEKGNYIFPESFPWSAANRISYIMNFSGPSLTIDTACASSLYAVHLACNSLKRGECKTAIVGGVNLYSHPSKYIKMCQINMLSMNGKCSSFGNDADGFVPGEGVGVLVLKPLSQAEKDGDHIYAVIKGSAINHGGKTNGYTVPNPNAQATLIHEAVKNAGINARSINYIEAHGTGTKLGDPIEVSGITKAFREDTKDLQFCALGSVKSNIGHLESAAGIAGIIKIILQMKHKELVPTLHCEITNPNIDFKNSPLYPQLSLSSWEKPKYIEAGELVQFPRRAGISGFGSGGSNAHVILEEYEEPKRVSIEKARHASIFVLSAKNKIQLEKYCEKFIEFLKHKEEADIEGFLEDLCFTSQVGRETMEVRIAMVIYSLTELKEKFLQYLSGEMIGLHFGIVKKISLEERVYLNNLADVAVKENDAEQIANLFVLGAEIKWKELEGNRFAKRISMPVYPFANKSYWLEKVQSSKNTITLSNDYQQLYKERGTLKQAVFEHILEQSDWIVAHHIVSEDIIVPGAAYISYVHSNARIVLGNECNWIKKIIFIKTCCINKESKIQVSFQKSEDNIEFNITDSDEQNVYSQGKVSKIPYSGNFERFDINSIKKRCYEEIDSDICYDYFRKIKLFYGKAFNVIQNIKYNDNEALSSIVLNKEYLQHKDVIINPALIDGAFQSVLALLRKQIIENNCFFLPYALEDIVFQKAIPDECMVYVKKEKSKSFEVLKFQIYILDMNGNVCVFIKSFSIRVLIDNNMSKVKLYKKSWKEYKLLNDGIHSDFNSVCLDNIMNSNIESICGDCLELIEKQKKILLYSEGSFSQDRQNVMPKFLYTFFKELINKKHIEPIQIMISYHQKDECNQSEFWATLAFLRSLVKEYSKVSFKLLMLKVDLKIEAIWKEEMGETFQNNVVLRTHEGRYIQHYEDYYIKQNSMLLRNGGIYVITGGMGGLGKIFASYLAKNYKAKLILIGRTQFNDNIDEKLKEFRNYGAEAEYMEADLSNKESVDKLVYYVKNKYGKIHGIIHAAGITKDSFLRTKEYEDYYNVISSKANSAVFLDYYTADIDLDFFVLFSSTTSIIGNIGQCDYAYANGYLDGMAYWRNKKVNQGTRKGKTISINWPLWKNGGMRVDEDTEELFFKRMGMIPLSDNDGISAFVKALQSDQSECIVWNGNEDYLTKEIMVSTSADMTKSRDEKQEKMTNIKTSIMESLLNMVVNILKVAKEDIDVDVDLSEYGFDSVTFTKFADEINSLYLTDFMPTIFFEVNTLMQIEELVGDKISHRYKNDVSKENVLIINRDNQNIEWVMDKLHRIISNLLKINVDDLEIDVNFSQYGFDSITFTKLADVINDEFNLNINPTIFFEYETILDLAQYLVYDENVIYEAMEKKLVEDTFKMGEKVENCFEKVISSVNMNEEDKIFEEKLADDSMVDDNAVAVIGMSGVYPKSKDLNILWNNLHEGESLISHVPENREEWVEFRKKCEEKNQEFIDWGGYIDAEDQFDALFFNISPREAQIMDPQQRIFLEHSWKAIEHAGYKVSDLAGSNSGVFVGVAGFDYHDLLEKEEVPIQPYTITGMTHSILANRVSFMFDFHGPSEAIDTACSSSLVALHKAVSAIQNKECNQALVGGVNLILNPKTTQALGKAGMLNKEGACKTFDVDANGYVRGEGVGVIFVKRLKDAIKDRDYIYAIIKSTAVNHGGKAKSLTAPNPNMQAELLFQAYKKAGVSPERVGYIEVHGTGTALGDPIEINGLKKAFQRLSDYYKCSDIRKNYCGLGSIKTNIGHLEAGAGIAGFIKVVLAMQKKKLPKIANFNKINPYINLEDSPFYILDQTKEWIPIKDNNGKYLPRVAGVSSFGFGGANAHAVVEEYLSKQQDVISKHPCVIVLSAKTKGVLKQYAKELREAIISFVNDKSAPSLANVAYTLQTGRTEMNERLAFVASSYIEILEKLEEFLDGKMSPLIYTYSLNDNINKFENIKNDKKNTCQLLKQQDFEDLAHKWCCGMYVVWDQLYEEKPYKVGLPTYPFEKKSYWIPGKSRKILSRQIGFLSKNYRVEQKQKKNEEKKKKRIFLIGGRYSNIKEKLEQYFEVVTNEDELNEISIDGVIDIIDLCNEKIDQDIRIANMQKILIKLKDDISFWYHLTHACHEDTILQEEYNISVIATIVKTISAERGKIDGKTISFSSVKESIAEMIYYETLNLDNYTEVRYKEQVRYVPFYERKKCEIGIEERLNLMYGVVVITGGTGGIGLLLAKYFAKRKTKYIILMGYNPLPQREKWKDILQENDDEPLIKKIKAILEIERIGTEVILYSGSLCDQMVLNTFFDNIRKELGPIDGIIHCAGSAAKKICSFEHKEYQDFKKVMEPKKDALLHLSEVLKNDDLKFFIVFSSVSAVIPELNVGICEYGAANSFMDAFVRFQRSQGKTYYRSVNWCNFKETGMGEVKSSKYNNLGLTTLTNKEALMLFDEVLSNQSLSDVIAYVSESEAIFEKATNYSKSSNQDMKLLKKKDNSSKDRDNLSKNKQLKGSISSIAKKIVHIFSQELNIPEQDFDYKVNFEEYGVDSIIMAELVTSLEKWIGDSLSPSVIIEYSNIELLASYFFENYGEKFLQEEINKKSNNYMKQENIEFKNLKAPTISNKKIAVVGAACHFPDADNLEEFWINLKNGIDSIKEVPKNRWQVDKYYRKTPEKGKSISKWGGFIRDIEMFDSSYFQVNEKLVSHMDPLMRQCLEVTEEALRDAGYDKKSVSGKKAGVYIGSRVSTFGFQMNEFIKESIIGTGQNFLAANLSHFYNLKGPSMVIDTACSSSLASIHLACQSLLNGETEMAVAGGVDLLLNERPYLMLSEAKALSPDGKCHTFDSSANGFVPGEGCGIVILKTLEQAIDDKDYVYAVIDASALNNDGHTMGITTPSKEGQKQVIKDALSVGNIDPKTISYVEAHGTGTMIGDPIELSALTEVFREYTADKAYCAIGSVKTNIGHLMSAAGIASFIKVILCLGHKQLVPTLNCDVPNPRFNFTQSPFYLNVECKEWNNQRGVKRAGISSFGFGGTNAHIIVSEAESSLPEYYKNERKSLEKIKFNKKRYWALDNVLKSTKMPRKKALFELIEE